MPRKALLVDGPESRRIFRRFLQLHGFDVRECDTLEEAVTLVPAYHPDLVVTELSRAGDPALERCRHLVGDLAVLFHGGTFSEWEAHDLGGEAKTAFLTRPFSLLDFHLTIQGLLRV